MQLEYYKKNQYGNTLLYLIDSPAAQAVLSLIGQKTISKYQILNFEKLGITFVQVFDPSMPF